MRAPGFWAARKPTAIARLLQPVGMVYGAVTARRMRRDGARAGAPVVCVGNFVAGGAGKTPTAMALARHADRPTAAASPSCRAAMAGRGAPSRLRVDPGVHDCGDGRRRAAAARRGRARAGSGRTGSRARRRAVEAGADVLVLDDGLQNPALAKDLAFAVVDGETGFGNGLCVPAGPLRAPLAAQAPLVQALIVVGGDDGPARADRRRGCPGRPLFAASLEPDALAAAPLIGREVVAFAGIARPEKFYATLRRIGAQVVATRDFPDHHAFAAARDRERWSRRRRGGARCWSRPRRTASGSVRDRPARSRRCR